jgi:regulator of sigma E protease
MSALSFVFAFVLMLGVLVFVHELGHFLVAKLFDVKVLKFSLGFGPAIGIGKYRLAFTRGETEYVVAWFPLGGFVKMLGENPDEEVREPAEGESAAEFEPAEPIDPADIPRAFNNKPVWQRLLVLFAGPAMNLLLPVVIFIGVLTVGMPRPEPVIGTIEPGSPAAKAGLAVGDRVIAVRGEPVQWWDAVEDDLRARPGESVPIRVERGGESIDAALALEDRAGMDAVGAPAQVGWSGLGHSRLAAIAGIPTANAPAGATDLRSGDRIVAVAGDDVEDWVGFASRYAAAGKSGDVAVRVERLAEGQTEPQQHELTLPALGSVEALGVVPATVLVAGTTPDSPAAKADLRAGDLIVAVDGAPVGSFAAFSELVRASGGRALEITYARGGERREISVKPQMLEADTGLGIPEERYLIGITAHAAAVQGAVGIDRETNPLVSIPRAVGMTAELTKTFLAGLKRLVSGDVSRKQLAGPIGIAEIAHNAFEQGWFAYLTTLILISINLAVLNLLPIPVLDGGQALLIAIEGIKRSPLSIRTRDIVQQIGVTVMVMLMGLAFWNDLSRHWSRLVDWVRHSAGL